MKPTKQRGLAAILALPCSMTQGKYPHDRHLSGQPPRTSVHINNSKKVIIK